MKIELTSLEALITTQALSYMVMDYNVNDEDRKTAYDTFCKIQDQVKKNLRSEGCGIKEGD